MTHAERMIRVVEEFRNLRPTAHALVCDPEADIKARWVAFDEFVETARGTIQPEQDDHRFRQLLAMTLMQVKGADFNEALAQAEALAPTTPDADTGQINMTVGDNAILNRATVEASLRHPDAWMGFFCPGDDLAPRKSSFRTLYTMIVEQWTEESLFPKTITEEQRVDFVILALMCHVPRETWGEADLRQIQLEVMPVEE